MPIEWNYRIFFPWLQVFLFPEEPEPDDPEQPEEPEEEQPEPMASFDIAYRYVERAEGGYQKYAEDSGNYNSLGQLVGTNWGISAPVYERWLGYPPSELDMRNMSQATAKLIYKNRFWDPIKGGQIQSQAVANILFDGHVNHGNHGIVLIQRVLGVPDDGIVGPITLGAINSTNASTLVRQYADAREDFYRYLASSRPSQSIFLQGWLNRLAMFRDNLPSSGEALAALAGAVLIYFFINK